jgi:hypothetical protein
MQLSEKEQIDRIRTLRQIFNIGSGRVVRNYNSKYYGSEFETVGAIADQQKQLLQGSQRTTSSAGNHQLSKKELNELEAVLSLSGELK